MLITLETGTATVYAGFPDAPSHRNLGTIAAGESLELDGVLAGEVVSLQGSSEFTYVATPGSGDPGDPGEPGDAIDAVLSYWECNQPGCSSPNWYGAVINWPAWSAYHTNNRAGDLSRSVFAIEDDAALYPYMGSWADGCEVTTVSGTVIIIEWERGTNEWRETWLNPGESHVINLTSPEDGAMIEGPDYSPGFSVTLNTCTPQPLP
jgi:hypothetical protein